MFGVRRDSFVFFVVTLCFRINGKFQTHLSYVGRNNCLRAMYKFTNPQATKGDAYHQSRA